VIGNAGTARQRAVGVNVRPGAVIVVAVAGCGVRSPIIVRPGAEFGTGRGGIGDAIVVRDKRRGAVGVVAAADRAGGDCA
jgi:hypothetical protein